MTHWSLAPDRDCKGSYYRRIGDIKCALDDLGVPTENVALNFVVYYFGCEKLAFGICGIKNKQSAKKAYAQQQVMLDQVICARNDLVLLISEDDLRHLFSDSEEQKSLPAGHVSARVLRKKLVHDFGPQQVKNISSHAKGLIPRMERFLGCAEQVLRYLEVNYSNVRCEPPTK